MKEKHLSACLSQGDVWIIYLQDHFWLLDLEKCVSGNMFHDVLVASMGTIRWSKWGGLTAGELG